MKRESSMRINFNRKPTPGAHAQANAQQQQPQQQAIQIMPIPQELVVAGRIVLNLWRIFKSEITLNIYTFENCCFHILQGISRNFKKIISFLLRRISF